jgi:hypothetical protein
MTLIDKIRTIKRIYFTRYDYRFPTETEEDHQDTEFNGICKITLVIFYSKTWNFSRKKMEDDVTEEIKARDYRKL